MPVEWVFFLLMAGLGAAFLFVPFFNYLAAPLAEATPTALLLNMVSLAFAVVTKSKPRSQPLSRSVETVAGAGMGSAARFANAGVGRRHSLGGD